MTYNYNTIYYITESYNNVTIFLLSGILFFSLILHDK